MKNFPSEYLFVDENANTFYKRYEEKKEICNINPYTLASTPVVFSNKATIRTLFELVNKNEYLKPFLFHFNDFFNELDNKKEQNVNGSIRFSWSEIDLSENYFNVSFPKMEVDGVDENDDIFGIDFLPCNEIADLPLLFDNNMIVLDQNGKEIKKIYTHPTLFQVLYGLFWELSFYGDPHTRDEKGKELLNELYKNKENKSNE